RRPPTQAHKRFKGGPQSMSWTDTVVVYLLCKPPARSASRNSSAGGMIRYRPAKATAGLTLSAVKGCRRERIPPARLMLIVFSSMRAFDQMCDSTGDALRSYVTFHRIEFLRHILESLMTILSPSFRSCMEL